MSKYSGFDLSEQRLLNADMGLLYPIFCRHALPGDRFVIKNEVFVRMQPGRAPLMTDINIYSHYFFVPYRILDANWEKFLRKTEGTRYDSVPYEFSPPFLNSALADNMPGGLLDHLYKVDGVKFGSGTGDYYVHSYPVQAYNMVYNEYYRDENLQDPLDFYIDNSSVQPQFDFSVASGDLDKGLKRRAWEKDYFTSSLPYAQRGIAPALPIFSELTPEALTRTIGVDSLRSYNSDARWNDKIIQGNASAASRNEATLSLKQDPGTYPTGSHFDIGVVANGQTSMIAAATFNVNDLRTAVAVQHWQEKNARYGVRYTELIQSHFHVSPNDSRLDRPEYIGGSKQPLLVSEVLQTGASQSDSPQGTMTGHGISVNFDSIGTYRCEEYGLIIGIMSIMPRAQYMSGLDREWSYRTPEEFYWPDFAYLGEQAVLNREIFASGSNDTEQGGQGIFGYQGRYDELRTGHDSVHGDMRSVYKFWSLARKFEQQPNLNSTFIECRPTKDFLFVQNEPGFIVSFANNVKAVRPMPKYAVPGLNRL